jgi:hypothetical protein
VVGLALPDVHVLDIFPLALIADVGFLLPDVHVLALLPWLASGTIAVTFQSESWGTFIMSRLY